MLTSEELTASWAADCLIDSSNLLERMYSHPVLHSKYLTHLQTYKLKLRSLANKYNKLKMQKTRWYRGEMDRDELDALGWKQYQYNKPIKSELESLLSADSDLQHIQEQMLYVQSLVEATESIMRDITNQYYLFKSLIEQQKFLAGI